MLVHTIAGGKSIRCRKCADRARRGSQPMTFARLWADICYGAKKRKIDVQLDAADAQQLLQQQAFRCTLTGWALCIGQTVQSDHYGDTTASPDRIDSQQGYVPGNVQWVHKHVNRAKGVLPQAVFVSRCRAVADPQLGRVCEHPPGEASTPPVYASTFWSQLRIRAKQQQRELTADFDGLMAMFERQGRRCALSSLPIWFAATRKQHITGGTIASLDRICSAKGYLRDNVQWLHRDVNFMKHATPEAEFVQMCVAVSSYYGGDHVQESARCHSVQA